jgi:hypothetical protein
MGTPMFLKQRFGFGYELTILRSPGASVSGQHVLRECGGGVVWRGVAWRGVV